MTDIDMVEIGKRIKELRVDNGLSQKQLAEKVGVASNTISQYEKGISKTSIDTIVNLAKALDTTTDYLLCLVDL